MELKEKHQLLRKSLQIREFAAILPCDLAKDAFCLDLSPQNAEFSSLDMVDVNVLDDYIRGQLRASGKKVGIGGHGEKREWYKRSGVFHSEDEEVRSIHLGIDVWIEAGAPLYAPLDGVIHSFQNNAAFGDYGPTVILEHELDGLKFFSLYGHLSEKTLEGKRAGDQIKQGARIGWIGNYPINGDWPPHVHFELMLDMLGNSGDFPGVAPASKKEYFLTLCPNPNWILRCPAID